MEGTTTRSLLRHSSLMSRVSKSSCPAVLRKPKVCSQTHNVELRSRLKQSLA